MIKVSLAISKLFSKKNSLAVNIQKKLNKNIYKKIVYPKNVVLAIGESFDFVLFNNLTTILGFSSIALNIKSIDDVEEMIIKYSNLKGQINKDILLYKVNANMAASISSAIKPNNVIIDEELLDHNELDELINKIQTYIKDQTYTISNNKSKDFYISNKDIIKEQITINQKYIVNVKEMSDIYLNNLLMLFAYFSSFVEIDELVKAINELNKKNFNFVGKKIFIDLEKTNYKDALKFITRFSDYKVLIIGWRLNIYEDLSWLYNVTFEQLLNKNIQKIYCIGVNAYDIAVRLKYADFNEKNIVVSPNIDLIIKDINAYNLNVYCLVDKYYEEFLKGGIK